MSLKLSDTRVWAPAPSPLIPSCQAGRDGAGWNISSRAQTLNTQGQRHSTLRGTDTQHSGAQTLNNQGYRHSILRVQTLNTQGHRHSTINKLPSRARRSRLEHMMSLRTRFKQFSFKDQHEYHSTIGAFVM